MEVMSVIPASRRLRQKDREFKASLGCISSLCFIKPNKKAPIRVKERKQ
jgi:hypothetical protein